MVEDFDEEKWSRLHYDITICKQRHDSLDEHMEKIRVDIATILAEQAKMKGFISGIAFVFAGLGVLIAHLVDKLVLK